MQSPVTCPDCGARRTFVGYDKVPRRGEEIRVFHCGTCGMTEKLRINSSGAETVERIPKPPP